MRYWLMERVATLFDGAVDAKETLGRNHANGLDRGPSGVVYSTAKICRMVKKGEMTK